MKNLLKFISIGLVLMVVVFSQMTQESSSVEAADVSENDIEFMDTADAVVKSYKASSTDTKVYLYVRDKDLNTTHTGTTEWASTHATETKPIIATSTFTLDTDSLTASLDSTGVPTAIDGLNAHENSVATVAKTLDSTTYVNLPTTSAGSGTGLLLNVATAADGAISLTAGGIGQKGTGYANNEVITVNGCLVSIVPTDCRANFGVVINGVTDADASAAGALKKTEDSDQGVTGGPNLYQGADTPLKLNTLTIKKGPSSLVIDQLNESTGTFSLNAAVAAGDTSGTDSVVASYSFSAQDVYSALTAGAKRVHVTSSSDATGEWVMIEEVSDEGVTNANQEGGILTMAAATVGNALSARTAGTYIVDPQEYSAQGNCADAQFKIVITGDGSTKAVPTINNGKAGRDCVAGNTITVEDGYLGGGAVNAVDTIGGILGNAATLSGIDKRDTDTTKNGLATTSSGAGTGLTVNVVIAANDTIGSISVATAGSGYVDNELITITSGLGTGLSVAGQTADPLQFRVNGLTVADLEFDVTTVQDNTAAAAVDTGIFMGSVNINTDASAGAADNGQVWVQDGDTLTASFYKAKSTDGNNTTGDLIK
ncbi:MAG: hypothetical protein CL765_07085, partial [Chloroflexi bacterium]|nr:hypothetical protein [Chloroflexota bacterium]